LSRHERDKRRRRLLDRATALLTAHTGEDWRNGEMLVLDGEQVSPFGRDRRALLLHA
jgi:hypothetical protein